MTPDKAAGIEYQQSGCRAQGASRFRMGVIRLYLALSVAVFHYQGPLKSVFGGTAVILFYMCSGFYMALVLNEKYTTGVKHFYKARLLRIFPMYWASIALFIAWMAYHGDLAILLRGLSSLPAQSLALVIIMNAFILGRAWHQTAIFLAAQHPMLREWIAHHLGDTMAADHYYALIGQAWTLEVELGFYLVAPFIVRSLRATLIWCSASAALRFLLLALDSSTPGDAWTIGYHNLPTTLCMFLLGALSYRVYCAVRGFTWARPVGVAALLLVLAVSEISTLSSPTGFGLAPLTRVVYDAPRLWSFYLFFAASLPFVFARFKTSRWDRLLGELSYPIYLLQGFGGAVMFVFIGGPITITSELTALAAVTALSAVTCWGVESATRRIAGWWTSTHIPLAVAVPAVPD